MSASAPEAAALVVNFYFYHNTPAVDVVKVDAFVKTVRQHLDLEPGKLNPAPNSWYGKTATTRTSLQRFFSLAPAADDTEVVQLAMLGEGSPAEVWKDLRARATALITAAQTAQMLGYTLTYYAMLPPAMAAANRCDELLPYIDWLGGATERRPAPIAQATLADGHLFLLATPVGDGELAATIYLALGALPPGDKELRLIKEGFLGRGATMLMPDLIAHKSYAQQRALQRNFALAVGTSTPWRDVYHDLVESLRTAVRQLLALHPAGEVALAETDLEPLILAYEELVSHWIDLDGYGIVLEQQHYHYEWWQRAIGGGPVIAYHGEMLRMAAKEVEVLLRKGQHVLDVARTTVEIARTRLEKRRLQAEREAEQRQIQAEREAEQRMAQDRELVGGWLAAISMGLAMPQFVTWDVACGWLVRTGYMAPTACTDYLAQSPFILQLVITVLVAVLVMVLVRWWLSRQHQGSVTGSPRRHGGTEGLER